MLGIEKKWNSGKGHMKHERLYTVIVLFFLVLTIIISIVEVIQWIHVTDNETVKLK